MVNRLQSGATTVEFGLVMIVFLIFFVGVVDFARMMWTWNAATEATRWGARLAVVCDLNAPVVAARMKKMLPQITAANVAIKWYDSAGNVTGIGAIPQCTFQNCAGVSVSIDRLNYQWISPLGNVARPLIQMPSFSTYLPREIMGQDPNSGVLCNSTT